MKKIAALFLLITYGFTSVGATVHVHYCMDKFVEVNLWQSKDKKCGKCGMKEKNKKGCCKEEKKLIKIEKAQQKTTIDYKFLFEPSTAILTAFTYYSFAETTIAESLPKANAPPPKQGVPFYILNCTYRI